MKHYGDICAMKGAEIEPVDVISFGAPCQDLSCAGKRAGMKHEDRGDEETTRSGLFFEAIRVIKEMREHDRSLGRTGKSIRCRYAIYENVPGALSSPGKENKGADWQAVLTELVRVAEPEAPDVPMPESGWAYADCLYGVGADGVPFSLAWRLTDAQHFGVAQRRERLCVLVDYAGLTAPWILFDPEFDFASEDGEPLSTLRHIGERAGKIQAFSESVQGNPDESIEAGEGTPCGTEGSAGEPGGCLNPWDVQSKHIQPEDGIAEALYSGECRYGGGESYTLKVRGGREIDSAGKRAGKGALIQTEMSGTLGVSQDQTLFQFGKAVDVYNQTIEGEISPTITAAVDGSNTSGPKIMTAGFKAGNSDKAYGIGYEPEMSPTIPAAQSGTNLAPTIMTVEEGKPAQTVYGICSYESNAFKSGNPHSAIYKADTSRTLDLNGGNPGCNQGGVAVVQTIPLEGNGARPSHYGAGYGDPDDPSFTLNHVEQHGVAVTYDARGNGDGKTACTLTGDHQDRVTDYTALVVKADGIVGKGNGEAWTTPERATTVASGGGMPGQGYPAALVTTDE